MPALPDTLPPCRYVIAVNHHRFHAADLVERTVRSALDGAALLRADQTHAPVCTVLFHDPGGLDADMRHRFAALPGLVLVPQEMASNGAALNAQMDAAAAAGARVFFRVDADDPVHPPRFRRQLRLLRLSGAAAVGGGLVYTNRHSGARHPVCPPRHPGPRAFLENRAMLHPTLCLDLASLRRTGVRYWDRRLEDKHLGLQMARAGLKVLNDDRIHGEYSLSPGSRSGLRTAALNLRLNLAFLLHTRRVDLVPWALALFCASVILPAQWLRRARWHLHRAPAARRPAAPTPCSGYGDGSETERKAL